MQSETMNYTGCIRVNKNHLLPIIRKRIAAICGDPIFYAFIFSFIIQRYLFYHFTSSLQDLTAINNQITQPPVGCQKFTYDHADQTQTDIYLHITDNQGQ